VFFGLASPRGTHRTAASGDPDRGGAPTLVWPTNAGTSKARVAATLPAAPAARRRAPLDVMQAEVQIATATSVFATTRSSPPSTATSSISDGHHRRREIEGINVRFDLPVLAAVNVLELRVRLVARSSRAGGDSILRTSIYNPSTNASTPRSSCPRRRARRRSRSRPRACAT